jgi:hypothetical protein
MKFNLLAIILIFLCLEVKAQPCFKLLDLKKGKSYTFRKSDKIIVFINEKKLKYKIDLITDSGFYSTNNNFIYFDSIYKVTAKNTINYIYYPVGGIIGLVTLIGVFSSTRLVRRDLQPFIVIPIAYSSLFFGIYQMATGFKRTYTIKENGQLLYFTDVKGIPNKFRNK